MIEVCSIMPYPWLEKFDDLNKMHLALAPQILHYDVYAKHFRMMSEYRNHYVIVDNGAYEGALVELGTLHAAAQIVRAHEVVVPDAMRDREKTMALYKEFARHGISTLYNHMVVLQGTNGFECLKMWDDLVKLWEKEPRLLQRATVSLPKWLKGERAAIAADLVNEMNYHATRLSRVPSIHFLGYGHYNDCGLPKWVTKHIRSLDTSMPSCAAIAKHPVMDAMPALSSINVEDFFEQPLPDKLGQRYYLTHFSNFIGRLNANEV